MEDLYNCPLCHFCGNYNEMKQHKSTLWHYFNYYLQQFQIHRGKLCPDRRGVSFRASLNDAIIPYTPGSGQHLVIVNYKGLGIKVKMDFRLSNNSNRDVFLIRCFTVHPHTYFKLDDLFNFTSKKTPNPILIKPGEAFIFSLTFEANSNVGMFKMPLCVNLQIGERSTFTLLREMVVNVVGFSKADENSNEEELSRIIYSGIAWKNVQKKISSQNKSTPDLKVWAIPSKYKKPLHALLDPKKINDLNKEEMDVFLYIQMTLETGPVMESYVEFFQILIWLEELKETIDLRKYNMNSVNFSIFKSASGPRRSAQLTVPGLAEKRPSLVVGDVVWSRLHMPESKSKELPPPCTIYMGTITKVENDKIIIDDFHSKFLNQIDSSTKVDVSFALSRLTYVRMHRALELVAKNLINKFFPKKSAPVLTENFQMFNKDMINNLEQTQAVRNIVANTSGTAPYIVFGPPGTGKTVTIVEAINQIIARKPEARVLLCAPSNMACDLLTSKLTARMKPNQLIRVHTNHRDWSAVPSDIKPYSNYTKDKGFDNVTLSQLNGYKVIVCTLVHAGKYAKFASEGGSFNITHVFIDEAGQAKEPECLIPLGGIAKMKTQLVLAGDPKQLGPVVNCAEASNCGLGTSLLERLMSTCSLYDVHPSSRDSNYITKLVKNFRSHPLILKISNDKFYDNELEPCSKESNTDSIVRLNILENHFKNGQAITFHGVSGDESRLGSSPSYFNLKEIDVVLQYVKALLSEKCPVNVLASDIGIISPYIRQVYKLKEGLKKLRNSEGVEIGTTEAFQGREKRIMIISTVRGSTELLWYDRKYRLGFVVDQRRFNVALTRAKSKLVVVGNPNCLMTGERQNCWPDYIDLCSSYQSVIGYKYHERDDNMKKDVIDKVKMVQIN